jgi:putative ABC transport system permease protein
VRRRGLDGPALALRVARRQLLQVKLRLAVALAGVAFAVVLILMQLGFRESMFESVTRYNRMLRYDLALLSVETAAVPYPKPFSDRRLFQARGVPGVAAVSPVYIGLALWKNPSDKSTRDIFVMGYRPEEDVLDVPELSAQLERVLQQDALLFDRESRPEFGDVAGLFARDGAVTTEVNRRTVDIAGTFGFGPSFGIDGSVVTSDVNFLRLFPARTRGKIDLGLVRLARPEDALRVQAELRALLAPDVLVLTRDEFIARDRGYLYGTTPIGYVFGFGSIVGVIVGAIIVYQILFSDISDHLAEYATLKALGYRNGFLSAVVLQQGLLLGALGFPPGLAISLGLYRLASTATRLPIYLTWERGLGVFALTLGMCAVSALLAVRRARSADPAEVF